DYAKATTRDAAVAAMAQGWTAKAGGVDLVDLLKARVAAPDKVASIGRVADDAMTSINATANGSAAGAPATLQPVAPNAAALAEACGDAASPQIRAVATVGGNLCQRPRCWYFRHAEYDCLKKGGSTCYAVDGDNSFHALFQQGTCHIVHPSNVGVALLALGG